MDRVVKLPPLTYIHVLNTNSNIVTVVLGPKRLTCLEHEQVILGPIKQHVIAPQHYAVIKDPVIRVKQEKNDNDDDNDNEKQLNGTDSHTNKHGTIKFDKNGQACLRYGHTEIRFSDEPPFALYPGEQLVTLAPLRFVDAHRALRLRAPRDFKEHNKIDRKAGDEWLFVGPGTYIPSEAEIVKEIRAEFLNANQSLHLRAIKDCIDINGKKRLAGEDGWLKLKALICLELTKKSSKKLTHLF